MRQISSLTISDLGCSRRRVLQGLCEDKTSKHIKRWLINCWGLTLSVCTIAETRVAQLELIALRWATVSSRGSAETSDGKKNTQSLVWCWKNGTIILQQLRGSQRCLSLCLLLLNKEENAKVKDCAAEREEKDATFKKNQFCLLKISYTLIIST